MSWYGSYNESAKQIEVLIQTKPSLANLMLTTDVMKEIKNCYNAKLLDYLSSNPLIGPEMVTYISVAPSETDTNDRKYKLPLLTIQLIQTEAPCILNVLLKPTGPNTNCFLAMFDILRKPQVLPLLAGYFNRVNLTLCRSRYKQALDSVYSSNQYLHLLIEHSYNQNVANCLPFYLCVDLTKNVIQSEDKIAIRLGFVRSIMDKIEAERVVPDEKSNQTIQNLFSVIREIVEKYYLIANGKQMLEIILEEKYIETIICMIGQQSQHSFPAMGLCLSFLKYYSLSSMNAEDLDEEKSRKNMDRLESQPFVKILLSSFRGLLDKVKKQKIITLYSYHLLEVLCHLITLTSLKVLNTIKQTELLPTLVNLLFKNQQNNILHKLVERTFLHIFSTERGIYQHYKQYLFCQISLIDLTAKRLLDLFPGPDCLQKAKTRGYFGVLIKIIKIYSSIVTTNTLIKQAITSKTQIWQKVTKKVLKVYEANCKQEIGQMTDVPQTVPIEFTVRKIQNQIMQRLIQNSEAIEQIKKQEETMPKTLEFTDQKKQVTTLSDPNSTLSTNKIQDDSFFKSPLEDAVNKKKGNFQFLNNSQNNTSADASAIPAHGISPEHKRSTSFTEFMATQKIKVGQEIKMQRSQSGEKRLSADKKTRLASPSPNRKRNSWKQQAPQVEKTDKRVALSKDMPKIPNVHKPHPQTTLTAITNNMTASTHEPNKLSEEDLKKMTTSMPNLHTLRNVTVVRTTQQPAQKKFRKVQDKDKVLFDFLGLKY